METTYTITITINDTTGDPYQDYEGLVAAVEYLNEIQPEFKLAIPEFDILLETEYK